MCTFGRKQPLAPPTSIRVDWMQLIKKNLGFYWGNWEHWNHLMKEVVEVEEEEEEKGVTTCG